jgi:hypothetical protein
MPNDPIDNKDNLKKYIYGNLNVATTQKNRDKLYPTKITNTFLNTIEAGEKLFEPNVLDSTGPYRAIVLSVSDAAPFESTDSILSVLFNFPWETTKKTAIARINEYHHAAIPMPPKFDDGTDGIHQFFIDMHDRFTSLEPIDIAVGDIILVDYKDRKNKKDGFIIKSISKADTAGGESNPGAQQASEEYPTSENDDSFQPVQPSKTYKAQNLCGDSAEVIATALEIGIEPAMLAAFRSVESGGGRNPKTIRFEPHIFNPCVSKSNPRGVPMSDTRGIGKDGKEESFSRVGSETKEAAFKKAYSINKQCALNSTSFGIYQVLGSNFSGINSNPDEALKLFDQDPVAISKKLVKIWFKNAPIAVKYANDLNFAKLAEKYNGSSYKQNNYDEYMAAAYEQAIAQCPEYLEYASSEG